MNDSKTFAFIKRKDKGVEKFQFPPLEEVFPRLKNNPIKKIELKNNFTTGWKKNTQNISNQLGSLTQEIIFENGEIFERTIQCRLDDSKHDNSLPHINVDISTKSKIIKKDKINHQEEIRLHYSLLDLDKFEHTWIGIVYSGRQLIQPILFPHNEKAVEYWKKQEELLNKRNSISEEEMKKLSDEIMVLYREMNEK